MQTQTHTPAPTPALVPSFITVTESAASKIKDLLAEESKTESGLRVFVQGGGCSGFQYGLMIEESGGVGDQTFESNGIAVRRSGEPQLPEGRRGRLRRHDHGRRLHDQEPERDVDLRLRFVFQRVSQGRRARTCLAPMTPVTDEIVQVAS